MALVNYFFDVMISILARDINNIMMLHILNTSMMLIYTDNIPSICRENKTLAETWRPSFIVAETKRRQVST